MDLNKLRTLVFEKTGIKIETNDPIFALVALNEAVLSECVEQHISGLQSAAEQLSQQTTRLIEAGDRVRQLLLLMRHTVEDPTAAPGLTPEQALLIQNGEKYAKIWPKLDAETQAKIQALSP